MGACVLAIALMLFTPFLEGVKYALPLGLATTYGISFSLFAFSLMYWRNSPLKNTAVGWIVTISSITYLMIEKPMINFGNLIIGARRSEVIQHAQA